MLKAHLKTHRTAALLIVGALALQGCEKGQGPTGRQVGMVFGAAAGVLIGSQIGSGVGRAAAIVGLAVLGGWLGGELGEGLTTEDRKQAGTATQDALANNRSGETQAWSNPNTGARGNVTPGPVYTPQRGAQAGRLCREIDVVVQPGKGAVKNGKRRACRKANGDWEVLEA